MRFGMTSLTSPKSHFIKFFINLIKVSFALNSLNSYWQHRKIKVEILFFCFFGFCFWDLSGLKRVKFHLILLRLDNFSFRRFRCRCFRYIKYRYQMISHSPLQGRLCDPKDMWSKKWSFSEECHRTSTKRTFW